MEKLQELMFKGLDVRLYGENYVPVVFHVNNTTASSSLNNDKETYLTEKLVGTFELNGNKLVLNDYKKIGYDSGYEFIDSLGERISTIYNDSKSLVDFEYKLIESGLFIYEDQDFNNLNFLEKYKSEITKNRQSMEKIEFILTELLNNWKVPEMVNELFEDKPFLIHNDLYSFNSYQLNLNYSNGVLKLEFINYHEFGNDERITLVYNVNIGGWKTTRLVSPKSLYRDLIQDEDSFNLLKATLKDSLDDLIKDLIKQSLLKDFK